MSAFNDTYPWIQCAYLGAERAPVLAAYGASAEQLDPVGAWSTVQVTTAGGHPLGDVGDVLVIPPLPVLPLYRRSRHAPDDRDGSTQYRAQVLLVIPTDAEGGYQLLTVGGSRAAAVALEDGAKRVRRGGVLHAGSRSYTSPKGAVGSTLSLLFAGGPDARALLGERAEAMGRALGALERRRRELEQDPGALDWDRAWVVKSEPTQTPAGYRPPKEGEDVPF